MKWLKSRQTTNFNWEPSFKRYFSLSIHSVILELNNFYQLEPFCERTLIWWFLIRNYDNKIIGNDDVFIIPGLDQQTFYHVRARSRNKAGLSDPSNIIYLKTNGEIPYQAKIGQPSPAGSIHCEIYLLSLAALVLTLSWWIEPCSEISKYHMVVGDYTNIMKTTFLFKLYLLMSFFWITSLQVIKEKIF